MHVNITVNICAVLISGEQSSVCALLCTINTCTHRRRNGFESGGAQFAVAKRRRNFFHSAPPLLACAPPRGGSQLGTRVGNTLKKLGLPLPHKCYGP